MNAKQSNEASAKAPMKWNRLPNGDYELCTPKISVRVRPVGLQYRRFEMIWKGMPIGFAKKLSLAKSTLEVRFTQEVA